MIHEEIKKYNKDLKQVQNDIKNIFKKFKKTKEYISLRDDTNDITIECQVNHVYKNSVSFTYDKENICILDLSIFANRHLFTTNGFNKYTINCDSLLGDL